MQTMKDKSKPHRGPAIASFLVALLKVGVAGAVICLIAFSIAVFDKDGSVTESQADIFDFSFGQKPNQVRFTQALDSMGHPEPQVFDLNGNHVHFSVNYMSADPPEVMRRYQEAFVAEQLNDQIFDTVDAESVEKSLNARLTGGITPVEIGPDRIVMAGMLTRNRALDVEDLAGDLIGVPDMDLFRGHRWIEIFREPGAQQSTVLASWSDEDFSYEKMLVDDQRSHVEGRSFDPDVPACPGCTRVNHFADLEDPRGYRSNIFVTSMAQPQMAHFYHQAMTQRGWEETKLQKAHEQIGELTSFGRDGMKKLSFKDGDRRLQIFIYPLDSQEIAVQTVLWDQLE